MLRDLPDHLLKLAFVVFCVAIVYKGFGFGQDDVGPLKISPQGMLDFVWTVLLFAVALYARRIGARQE